jgi:hypothetical protein
MKPNKQIRRVYQPRERPTDFLKYWRVVRMWVQSKHGVGVPDLELMLYLYSAGLFTKKEFNEFEFTLNWDKKRFGRLRKEGWINQWREATTRQKALYELSFKGKKLIRSVYKKLLGEETISESGNHNPIFKDSATYSQKRVRPLIAKLNSETTSR